MINFNTSKKLNIILPNTNKALSHVVADATKKELEVLSKGKDLKSIINNIFKKSIDNKNSNKELLQLVKNNPTLKNLGSVSNDIKDLLNSLKSDKNPLPIEKVLKTLLTDIKDLKPNELKQKIENSGVFLESKLKNIKNPQVELKNILTTLSKELQTAKLPASNSIINDIKQLLNSEPIKSASISNLSKVITQNIESLEDLSTDVKSISSKLSTQIKLADTLNKPDLSQKLTDGFNKLKNLSTIKQLHQNANIKEIASNDLKSLLLQTEQEIKNSSNPLKDEVLKNIDKLTLQIDNYQLLSHLNNSSSLYIPFSWDALEDGKIEMKKAKDDKFVVDIDLRLKDYGELNLNLTLYEKNQLNIHIYSSNKDLKKMIQENIQQLRSALIDMQITPREIRILEPKQKIKTSPYISQADDINMGFEVKA